MLGLTIAHFYSTALGLVLGDWYTPVVLILLLTAGGYGYFRFRGVPTLKGIRESDPEKAVTNEPVKARTMAVARPNRSNLARAASGENASRSENYSESVEISHLPIGKIREIVPPKAQEPLFDSEDEGLLAAIDEVQDDCDADSEFRLVALRVLAGFKTRNSIDALSQIALYDLSSTLRSKAVTILSQFDHVCVFEPIVLACADPSREVRASAARALVQVSFDRGDEWARIGLSNDQYMSRQIARAAVEGGIAERSFDRLVMQDEKAVYESFALVYLLIKTGETEKIFDAIRNHRDIKTRAALLHSLKVANIAEVMPELSAFIAAEPMGSVLADKARQTLLEINAIPVNA